ncbi:MAG: hypothetical protein MUQ26_03810, partial [Armatimonadetes bacterium]|nr:hypothetical protein [Armatimonadota bacterium]
MQPFTRILVVTSAIVAPVSILAASAGYRLFLFHWGWIFAYAGGLSAFYATEWVLGGVWTFACALTARRPLSAVAGVMAVLAPASILHASEGDVGLDVLGVVLVAAVAGGIAAASGVVRRRTEPAAVVEGAPPARPIGVRLLQLVATGSTVTAGLLGLVMLAWSALYVLAPPIGDCPHGRSATWTICMTGFP